MPTQINCPVCRATNDTGPTCRRCRADLEMCFAVEARRANAIAAARFAVVEGRLDDAINSVRVAVELRRGPDVDQLIASVHLLAGDLAAAWNEHANVHQAQVASIKPFQFRTE